MANDNRGSSSLFRRAEQLRRWQESETNKQDISNIKSPKKRKVKFSDGCIFLAAGAAGDKEELKRLLDRGADVNTVNQDGITALHAACIDNNLEIVEFLVDNDADINQCDMEGWTPLHATASCGSLSMAEFLISRGADLSLVNNDGELAIDVADEDDMANLLQEEMDKRGIDCDASRMKEERLMLLDARAWLSNGKCSDLPHPKTGATALHVAAAKGYTKVMSYLFKIGVDVNAKDYDGWTALHAAAHWGQNEAVEILCDSMADMDSVNNVGQTAYDLADEDIKPLMDELARKQASLRLKRPIAVKRNSSPPRKEKYSKMEKEQSSLKKDPDGLFDEEMVVHESDPNKTVKSSAGGDGGSPIDISEVQSWRRASIKNKTRPEDKVATGNEVSASQPKEVVTKHSEEEVILRRDLKEKEKNCQDILRSSDSEINTSSSSATSNSTRLANSLLHSSRTFAPPARDEESETQRKAHAKMVRSTRRSTQGITLEDVKSAEQYIKTTTKPATFSTTTSSVATSDPSSGLELTMTTTAASETVPSVVNFKSSSNSSAVVGDSASVPSRAVSGVSDKADSHQDNSFLLESAVSASNKSSDKLTSQLVNDASNTSATEEKKDEKNDDKTLSTREGTQAVIQRRKKAKRRSTGVVHVDMDEIDPDRKSDKPDDGEGSGEEGETYQSDKEQVSSRVARHSKASTLSSNIQNGEIDYKKLYEEQLAENGKLLDRIRMHEKDLKMAKDNLEAQHRIVNATAESERREKRSLERKLSEMEEEVKEFEQLRLENERLKDENGALIRVISKLSR